MKILYLSASLRADVSVLSVCYSSVTSNSVMFLNWSGFGIEFKMCG